MSGRLMDRLLETIRKYYPVNIPHWDPSFEHSPEWKAQLSLRQDARSHAVNSASIYKTLSELYPSPSVDDNSCPSVDTCYHFRILLEPQTGWPSQAIWNWDLKLVEEHRSSIWLNLFYCYLGPFLTGVIDEFKFERGGVFLRRYPARVLDCGKNELLRVLPAFEKECWIYIPFELQAIVPYSKAEARGMNTRTIFELLFSETYPAPERWDGLWDTIDPRDSEPVEVMGVDFAERPLGEMVNEATLRNELGFDPELRKKRRQ
jgi:hypothetical protein